jgi:hypothetical protein
MWRRSLTETHMVFLTLNPSDGVIAVKSRCSYLDEKENLEKARARGSCWKHTHTHKLRRPRFNTILALLESHFERNKAFDRRPYLLILLFLLHIKRNKTHDCKKKEKKETDSKKLDSVARLHYSKACFPLCNCVISITGNIKIIE